MSVKKFAVGNYDDEAVLFPAVRKVRNDGFKLHNVYTPFFVHGLEDEMGLKETDLHVAGFIFGLLGTATALGFMTWIFTVDWPTNFGGKPYFSLPAFIPITFELTVLFSAVGMVLTYCWLNQIMPGVKKHVFNPRSSDDQFAVVVEVTDDQSEEDILKMFKETGAISTDVQTAESGWWYGLWAKDDDFSKGFAQS